MKAHFFETVEKTCGFSDKRLAVCCAHNLPAGGGQIPHLQTEKYFLSRTCRERKWLSNFLPPAGGKLCEAFLLSGTRRAPFPVPGEERPRKTAQRNEVEVKAEQQASLQRADGRERHRPGDRPRDERCDDDRVFQIERKSAAGIRTGGVSLKAPEKSACICETS